MKNKISKNKVYFCSEPIHKSKKVLANTIFLGGFACCKACWPVIYKADRDIVTAYLDDEGRVETWVK